MSEPTKTYRSPYWGLLIAAFAAIGLTAAAEHLLLVEFTGDGVGVVDRLDGTSGVALSADDACLYTTSELEDALTVFKRSAPSGSLVFDEVREDGIDGDFGLAGASAVASAPDGRHVYVTGGTDDTLAVFRRDATQDDLVFVADQTKENLVGGVAGLDGASSVAVSGDDEAVFVTGSVDDAVAVFRRDATLDTLTFVEASFDGFDADGLDGASDVAVSPDHQHVYVTGAGDHAVAVFERQPDDTIDHVASYFDGTDGVEGLLGASSVVVSPDGAHVYVASATDDALVSFARDGETGELTFLQAIYDGQFSVDGLDGAVDVAISADGRRVLVAAQDDNAVSLFRRSPSTGSLAFLDVEQPILGLGGVRSLALTADRSRVYAAAHGHDGVAGLIVALCQGQVSSGDSDLDAFCDDVDLCIGDDLVGDDDGDGVCDDVDGCPGADDGLDGDGDGVANGCDDCQGDDAEGDEDSDGVCDDQDVCPGFADGQDSDLDGAPDGCDLCLGHDLAGDTDSDGVCDNLDVCSGFDDGIDTDSDDVPDGCDNCQGDDRSGDGDGDLVCDDLDCAPDDPFATELDTCGVCGGDSTTCAVFVDGFESGNVAAWSSVIP